MSTGPPSDEANVPTNATLFAQYGTNAEYLGEEIVLEEVDGESTVVNGRFDPAERTLSVEPELTPGQAYIIHWPGLRGVNSANKGSKRNVRFTVGEGPDTEPPEFDGIESIDWDWQRDRDDCTDSLEDRFVFDVELARAEDDGGKASLTIVIFQTKGPRSDDSELIHLETYPDDRRLEFTRTVETTTGDICFAAIARDLTGKISTSGSNEYCLTTAAPPFFDGCALGVSSGRSGGAPGYAALALALLTIIERRRRR